jgi:nucleoside-diphosphate-sugar epimerase
VSRMGEKALVTGGAGFMGSALVRALADEEYDVYSYDNFVTGTASNVKGVIPHDHIIRGDVESWKFMKTLSTMRPEKVFHLAADPYIPLSYDHPERFVRTNFEGTLNVLMTCKTFDVKKIVHYSTSEVYGSAKTIPMNEQHPTKPQSVYAVSKLAADHLCQVLATEQKIPVVVVRPFNCYGPRETHPYVVPEIVSQLARSEELVLGNLEARRDLTYVDDTARAVCMLASKEGIEGQVFNIGFGQDYSIRELAEKTSSIMRGTSAKIRVDAKRLRPYDVSRLICDSSRLRDLTGWKPEVALEDGLKRTIEWYKANGSVWEWERRYSS